MAGYYDSRITYNNLSGLSPDHRLHITKNANTSSVRVVDQGGTVYVDGDLVDNGDILTITITANSGSAFDTLTVNGVSLANGGTYTAADVVSVVAVCSDEFAVHFAGDTHLTVGVTSGGVAITSGDMVDLNGSIIPTGVPATGYIIDTFKINGVNHTSGQAYTVVGNTNIVGTSKASEYTISYMEGVTVISGLTPTKYTYGVGVAALPVAVKEGYTFNGWYGDSGLTGDAITGIGSTETGNKVLYAKFTAN